MNKVILMGRLTRDAEIRYSQGESASGGGDNSGFNPSDRPSPSSAAGDGFMNIPDGIDEELPFN